MIHSSATLSILFVALANNGGLHQCAFVSATTRAPILAGESLQMAIDRKARRLPPDGFFSSLAKTVIWLCIESSSFLDQNVFGRAIC